MDHESFPMSIADEKDDNEEWNGSGIRSCSFLFHCLAEEILSERRSQTWSGRWTWESCLSMMILITGIMIMMMQLNPLLLPTLFLMLQNVLMEKIRAGISWERREKEESDFLNFSLENQRRMIFLSWFKSNNKLTRKTCLSRWKGCPRGMDSLRRGSHQEMQSNWERPTGYLGFKSRK